MLNQILHFSFANWSEENIIRGGEGAEEGVPLPPPPLNFRMAKRMQERARGRLQLKSSSSCCYALFTLSTSSYARRRFSGVTQPLPNGRKECLTNQNEVCVYQVQLRIWNCFLSARYCIDKAFAANFMFRRGVGTFHKRTMQFTPLPIGQKRHLYYCSLIRVFITHSIGRVKPALNLQ